jgi:CDP-glucose 4,6-dehydratase
MEKNFWKDKKVFVTGGAGFIGGHLVDRLLSLEANVKLFTHEKHYQPLVSSLMGDLCTAYGLQVYLEEFQPEIVFHLAAQPIVGTASKDDLATHEINIRGTYNLLSACRFIRSIKRFVHISTDKVYGDTPVITDNSELNGLGHPYNTSKLAGDQLAQMYSNFYNLPVIVLRHGNIYGPRDLHWDRIIPRTIKKVIQNEHPIARGDGKSLRDYIYVSDIVDGYIQATERELIKKPQTWVLGAQRPYSTLEVIDTVLKVMKRIDLAPTFEKMWKGEIPNQHIESRRAKDLLGWNPKIDLEAGIELTVPYYVELFRSSNNG